MKRLYEIHLPARVMCSASDGSAYIDVDHLDGAYSFCRSEKGAICHLYFGVELEQNADGTWRIVECEVPLTPVGALEIERT